MPPKPVPMQLICKLCPLNPLFSDVSHLLTHMSSKSHLSNRFKLQIRAQSEQHARLQLENFDDWYDHNGLDKLLSERLAAKEQRKAAKDRRAKALASVGLVIESYYLLVANSRSASESSSEG